MTDQVRFEVGDEVETITLKIRGVIADYCEKSKWYQIMYDAPHETKWGTFDGGVSPPENLRKISSPSPLNLEVGKKYNIKAADNNPYVFLSNTLDHGFKGLKYPYVFINDIGEIENFSDDFIKESVIEHRPLIKNEVVGWAVFHRSSEAAPSENDIIYNLLERSAYPFIYKEYRTAEKLFPLVNKIYGRFTFEQLPEPKE